LIYIILLFFAFIFIILLGLYKNAEIQFSPILGFMIGTLISYEEIDDDNIEYTLQCCLVFISLTVVWNQEING
tara:strand:- start:3 stop:221 length:219 start_codon:yes stop_codon:yes gene_type:complete